MRNSIDEEIGGGPPVNLALRSRSDRYPSVPSAQGVYRLVGKRVLDVALVLVTLPLTLGVIILAAIALWIEGGRPFYSQTRLGQGGSAFRMLKLRTMTRDAESRLDHLLTHNAALRKEWRLTQKLKNDPRITRVGRFLRATSIDELPQVWNILKGEMSFVGPRPMMPDQLELYGDPRAYFAVRPGLSGLWQVRVRNDSHFSYRAIVDESYDTNMSVWLDLHVLWKTVGVVLRRTGH